MKIHSSVESGIRIKTASELLNRVKLMVQHYLIIDRDATVATSITYSSSKPQDPTIRTKSRHSTQKADTGIIPTRHAGYMR